MFSGLTSQWINPVHQMVRQREDSQSENSLGIERERGEGKAAFQGKRDRVYARNEEPRGTAVRSCEGSAT